jgi:GAF domain-containing protein
MGREAVELSINAQLRQAVEAAGEAATLATSAGETAEEAAKLYERWLRELETLFAFLETGQPDRDAYARAIFRFINTRVEDISTWVGGHDEEVRAALWWWSDADGGASIVAAPRIADRETLEHVFHPGEGLLGRVLADGEPVNLGDAPDEIEWVRITPGRQRYRGLLCLPIIAEGRVAGVLSVDRAKAEPFSDEAVRFARQVASLIKLAAFHAAVPSEVFSLPLPGPSGADALRAPDSP